MRVATSPGSVGISAILALALLGHGAVATAQGAGAVTQRVVRSWTANDGLPSDSISSLIRGRDGYLWIGTNVGLVRFDGSRFVALGRDEVGVGITSLCATADGAVWAGTLGGHLGELREGRARRHPGPAQGFSVTGLAPQPNGDLWVSTLGAGVYRRSGDRYERLELPWGVTEVLTMLAGRDGSLWMGGRRSGLLRWRKGEVTQYGPEDGLADETTQALLEDQEGRLWVGTEHGLSRLENGVFTTFDTADGLPHTNVTALAGGRDGEVWVATKAGGLARFAEGRFEPLSRRVGLASDDVRALLEDHEGNLWAGTAAGLTRVSQALFATFGQSEGLTDATVHTVVPGRNDDVWIGTGAAGVFRIHGDRLSRLPVLRDTHVMALHEARDGSLWVATGDSRLFRVRDSRAVELTPVMPDGLIPKVSHMTEAIDGEMTFAGSTIGLGRVAGGTFAPLFEDRPPIHFIFTSRIDARGRLWIGTSEGLVRSDEDGFTRLTTRDGLAEDRVRSIWADADGTLWLATMGGLSRLRDGAFATVTTADGLPDPLLRVVLDDGLGHLWLSSVGHVFRLSKSELEEFLAGRAGRVAPTLFDVSDGLRSTEVPLSAYAGCRTADGRLWFATANGVSVVDPRRALEAASLEPAQPLIEAVQVNGNKERRDPHPPGEGRVEIEYTALGLRMPEKLRFRYRLEGIDEDWVEAGSRRTAFYTQVPPGRHRFRVVAGYRAGAWGERAASVDVHLAPHFYQTRWFMALCVLATALAGAATQRIRVRWMRRRQLVLARKIQEAVAHIHTLRGLLPVCAWCRKIRDDDGYWSEMEAYIEAHSEAGFTHSICPECKRQLTGSRAEGPDRGAAPGSQ